MTKVLAETSQKQITDPNLEPYFIVLDPYCFILKENITPDPNYESSGKVYQQIIGHYSKLGSCLEVIAKLKTNTKSYNTIKEYIGEYKRIVETLKSITEI